MKVKYAYRMQVVFAYDFGKNFIELVNETIKYLEWVVRSYDFKY